MRASPAKFAETPQPRGVWQEDVKQRRNSTDSNRVDAFALEFLSVVAQSRPYHFEAPVALQRSRLSVLRDFWRRLQLTLSFTIVTTAMVYPFLIFVIMVPLRIRSLPMPIYQMHFWLVYYTVAVVFGHQVCTSVAGDAPKVACMLAWWFPVCAIGQGLVSQRVVPCKAKAMLRFAGVLLSLNLPCTVLAARRGLCNKRMLVLAAFLTYGATPVLVSAVFYFVAHGSTMQDADGWWEALPLLILWVAVQVPVKAIGSNLLSQFGIDCFLHPLQSVLYMDIVFGVLGLATFARSWYGNVTFLLSLVVLFALNISRGCEWSHSTMARCFGRSGTLENKRLSILLNCCCLTLGRLTAYGTFFLASSMRHVFGNEELVRRPDFDSREQSSTTFVSVTIFFRQEIGPGHVVIAAVCSLFSLLLLLLLAYVPQLFWGESLNRVVPLPQTAIGGPDDRSFDAETSAADADASSQDSSTIASLESGEILAFFVRMMRPYFGSCSLFVVLTCAATTFLGETLLWAFDSPSLCTQAGS
eukprot:TRINITY_DN12174_c0_g1_i5.p1 TRINITY_DN12174_c0_g1~~TRINITY_DN12174_c0_g1_i5.p1  ORF type:complete len:527 (+),score=29.90 TRINITY_DN12174_c0_g1_i5:71-1651(+)